MVLKSKKKFISKKRKNYKQKYTKKGGAGLADMAKTQLNKIVGNDKCDLSVDYISGLEKTSYSPQKMLGKLEKTELLEKENPPFKKLFKKNMTSFCGSSKENRYLKFCSNLFNCVKTPKLFYEVMNDIFDLDIKDSPKLKNLYEKKKKITPTFDEEQFYNEEKGFRSESVSLFFVNVIFKTINEYEEKYPPKNKSPIEAIFLKQKFLDMFKNFGMDIKIKTETIETFKSKILDKETAISDYYTARVLKSDDKQNLNENKDDRSSSFIFILIGGLLTTLIIRSDIFSAPPGIMGSVT